VSGSHGFCMIRLRAGHKSLRIVLNQFLDEPFFFKDPVLCERYVNSILPDGAG
jgi:hypothetical protein